LRAELTLGVAVGFLGVFSRSVAAAAPPEHSHKVEEDRGSMAFRERIEREKSGIETNGWWGQPMDPKVFWRDKVVWLDAVAIDAARQRGRRMPPPAFDDSAMSLESYSSLIIDGAEGARERLYAHECRFWVKWTALLPRPPGDIEARQERAAADYFWLHSSQYAGLAKEDSLLASPEVAVRDRLSAIQLSALDEGFPVEAFEPDALYGVYVPKKRQEYAKRVAQGLEDGKTVSSEFGRMCGVSSDVIVHEVTDEEDGQSSAWKIRYLRRLLRTNTDESYLLAYCKAWKLPYGTLKAKVRAEERDQAPEDLSEPAVIRDRGKLVRARQEARVLQFLTDGEESAARILANRYWLDIEELQERAQVTKNAILRSRENQVQDPEELTKWRKKRLRKMIAHGDEEEAQTKAKEWGMSLADVEE
jgi:hypothetical protein